MKNSKSLFLMGLGALIIVMFLNIFNKQENSFSKVESDNKEVALTSPKIEEKKDYVYEPNKELRKKDTYNMSNTSLKNPSDTLYRKLVFVGEEHCKMDSGLSYYKTSQRESMIASRPDYYDQYVFYTFKQPRPEGRGFLGKP